MNIKKFFVITLLNLNFTLNMFHLRASSITLEDFQSHENLFNKYNVHKSLIDINQLEDRNTPVCELTNRYEQLVENLERVRAELNQSIFNSDLKLSNVLYNIQLLYQTKMSVNLSDKPFDINVARDYKNQLLDYFKAQNQENEQKIKAAEKAQKKAEKKALKKEQKHQAKEQLRQQQILQQEQLRQQQQAYFAQQQYLYAQQQVYQQQQRLYQEQQWYYQQQEQQLQTQINLNANKNYVLHFINGREDLMNGFRLTLEQLYHDNVLRHQVQHVFENTDLIAQIIGISYPHLTRHKSEFRRTIILPHHPDRGGQDNAKYAQIINLFDLLVKINHFEISLENK